MFYVMYLTSKVIHSSCMKYINYHFVLTLKALCHTVRADYHNIAGNFRGRKLSRRGEIERFSGENIRGFVAYQWGAVLE